MVNRITLRCVRNDGRIESTELERLSLREAYEMAERILRIGNGPYTEVDLCMENGYIEKIRKGDTVVGAAS